jgi:hypothetical protein
MHFIEQERLGSNKIFLHFYRLVTSYGPDSFDREQFLDIYSQGTTAVHEANHLKNGD